MIKNQPLTPKVKVQVFMYDTIQRTLSSSDVRMVQKETIAIGTQIVTELHQNARIAHLLHEEAGTVETSRQSLCEGVGCMLTDLAVAWCDTIVQGTKGRSLDIEEITDIEVKVTLDD